MTHKNNIDYGAGKLPEVNELTAHELTHAVQQTQTLSYDQNIKKLQNQEEPTLTTGKIQHNVTEPCIQRWVLPTDWLDYIGLGVDIIERIYIELGYEEGQEKEFKRFVNTLFFVIDSVLAATPGAGGGGLALRGSRQLAIAGWGTIPQSIKLKIAQEVAERMGWSLAKAWQMINLYMSASGKGSGGTPRNNRAQNKQFNDAVREIEKRIGRKLSKDEIRQLHDAISGQDYGFHDIVEEGVGMFGGL